MQIMLEQIENEYNRKIQQLYADATILTATNLLELSAKCFHELKISGVSNTEHAENDMLLFQYGIFNWCDELGEYFSFDITRQCFTLNEDEPYQLNFELIFDPEPFRQIQSYNCWSADYPDIDSFFAHIKGTDGFVIADKTIPKSYRLQFSQC